MWKLILVIDQINKANLQTCQRICIRNKTCTLNINNTIRQNIQSIQLLVFNHCNYNKIVLRLDKLF